jgi:hypothetical protein
VVTTVGGLVDGAEYAANIAIPIIWAISGRFDGASNRNGAAKTAPMNLMPVPITVLQVRGLQSYLHMGAVEKNEIIHHSSV